MVVKQIPMAKTPEFNFKNQKFFLKVPRELRQSQWELVLYKLTQSQAVINTQDPLILLAG